MQACAWPTISKPQRGTDLLVTRSSVCRVSTAFDDAATTLMWRGPSRVPPPSVANAVTAKNLHTRQRQRVD